MVATAASLFAVNGVVSKVIEANGFSSQRLTEVRSTGAFLGLALIVAATRRDTVGTSGRELILLVALGIGGLALVQWSYFFAIHRLPIGEALLVQYVAPLLVALWARFVYREAVRRRISLSAWGFLFAALFWAAVQPWWTFPSSYFRGDTSLLGHLDSVHLPIWLLVAWMVVLGTIVPFVLVVGALRHVSATRVGIVAMLEPVVAILVAWMWLGEALVTVQLIGATLALTGIALAQTAR